MTETDWLACGDPRTLLKHLGGKTYERKLQLFTSACARDVWTAMTEECSRRAVQTAERFADEVADRAQMAESRATMLANFRNHKRRAIFDDAWAETNDGALAGECQATPSPRRCSMFWVRWWNGAVVMRPPC